MAPGTTTVTLASGLSLVRRTADRGLGLAISRDAFEYAERACAARLVGPGEVIIDGGAHLGAYALPLAQRVGASGRVYAYEPHNDTRALLSMAVALNHFTDRVMVSSAALGDVSGPGILRTPRRSAAHGHACLTHDRTRASRTEALIPVPIERLDDAAIAGRVTLIKLDIEGAELLAIRGALGLIRRDHPAIICELGDEQLARVSGTSSEAVMATLRTVGYAAHHIGPDGAAGPRLEGPPTARLSTVLFLPAP